MKKILYVLLSMMLFVVLFNGIFTSNTKITAEGGIAIKLVNRTPTNSITGQIASIESGSTNAGSYIPFWGPNSNANYPVGVVYEDDEDIGDDTWVVFAGVVDVLIATNTFASNGYYVYADTNSTRAIATNAVNLTNGQSYYADFLIGYAIQNVTNHGTNDVTCKILLADLVRHRHGE